MTPSPRRFTRLAQLVGAARDYPSRRIAVAAAHDLNLIQALADAQRAQLCTDPILYGRRDEILRLAEAAELVIRAEDVIDEPDDHHSAVAAAGAVREGTADVLMKGKVHTDDFLRGVLHKESGLRAGNLMSHCFVLEHPREDRLLLVTDAGMNIAPNLDQKAAIALNAIYLAEVLGIPSPRVAALAAVELVNPAMPATVDAAVLGAMSRRRQFSNGVLDGPFGMDNAVSQEAAATKGIGGPVAGAADILLVPDIEAGNIMVKTYSFLCGGPVAGALVGASAPVVLTSRADSAQSKLYSIGLAVLMANTQRSGRLKIGKVRY